MDEKTRLELDELHARILKIGAETTKIQAESKWYPFVVVAGLFVAAFGVAKFFFT